MNDLASAIRNSADHKLLNNYDKIEMNVNNLEVNHTISCNRTNNLSVPSVIFGALNG